MPKSSFFLALAGMLVAGLGIMYLLQPDRYSISRSREVSMSREQLYERLVDMRIRKSTRPLAPDEVLSVSSAPTGLGAWGEIRWPNGYAKTVITAASLDAVEYHTESNGSFGTGESSTRIELTPAGTGTAVTYIASSDLTGIKRFLWPIVGANKMIIDDVEARLAGLER